MLAKKILFIILLLPLSVCSQQLAKYRYWYDDNFSSVQTTVSTDTIINLSLNVNSLSFGFHQLNFQSQDNSGFWSPIVANYFLKNNTSSIANSKYRYWYDNNFSDSQTIVSSDSIINLSLNTNSLSKGFHTLNFQTQDASGSWSSIISQYFLKTDLSNNNLNLFRYWFDDDFTNAKTKFVVVDSTNDFTSLIDVESLSLGRHQLSYQFSDRRDKWTSIISDSITRGPITSKTFIEPKVYVSKAVLEIGQTQTMSGNDFTVNGQIILSIWNSKGDLIPANNSFTYLPSGSFSYSFIVTSTMPDGEYKVYATDLTTGTKSPEIKFKIVNPIQNKLWVTEPTETGTHIINSSTQIIWKDFVTKSNAIGVSGYVQKNYKIEYTNNNGTSWQIINNNYWHTALNNQNNQFNTTFSFLTAGTYKIRITDLENAQNTNTSSSFDIINTTSSSFTYSLEWDKSIPYQTTYPNPLGLAADGTCRILIKLSRVTGNINPVKKIVATITPEGTSPGTGISVLGKIKPARIHDTYNLEANDAGNSNCDTIFTIFSSDQDYWFWLVAPDDFTNNQNSKNAERTIKVTFTVTYSDNSTTSVLANNIRIVRPPLIMVHGLNGSSNSFDKTKYRIDDTTRYFINAGGTDGLFKDLVIPQLKNYESYIKNAEILLGIGDLAYRSNSFQRILKRIHEQGFAANRLDYVCHSMGGCVARTVINKYDSYYRPSITDTATMKYRNYGQGFINKLITINTPHNGSPVADLIDNLLGNGIGVLNFLLNNKKFEGYFVKTSVNGKIYYNTSPAIKDLKAVNGGIRFSATNVKNHLIGGDIDRYNVPDALLLANLNSTGNTSAYLSLFQLLMPQGLYAVDGLIDYLNAYISIKYNYPNFLSNSDAIVPITSQFPNINQNNIRDLEDNAVVIDTATIGYGVERNHIQITDDLEVGTTIMRLLNSPINSGYFSNQIPANLSSGGIIYSPTTTNSISDSIFSYIDTDFVKIINPTNSSTIYVDSIININLLLKDTINLKGLQVIFQGEFYQSFSKILNQTFNIKVHSNSIGNNTIVVQGMYDSSGYYIYHTDTVNVLVKSLDTLKGFYLSPKTQNLSKNHIFDFTKNAIYSNYVGGLTGFIDSLGFQIADTNVVRFDTVLKQFSTKDTGTTYIVYNYKGLIDTAFIYVSEPLENNIVLPITLESFSGVKKSDFNLLEWKALGDGLFSHFVLQKSTNIQQWVSIKRINSIPGFSMYSYNCNDSTSLYESVIYYRLLMFDNNGSFKVSNVVAIRRGNSNTSIRVFPNPVTKSEVFIDLGNYNTSTKLTIGLFDITGKSIKTIVPTIGNNLLRLDLNGIKPSFYMLKISKGNEVNSFKLVVL